MRTTKLLIPVLMAPCLALLPVLPQAHALAAPYPHSIPLPNDFQPEGIAVGTGHTFYVGSMRDGDIYRGDLRTGRGSVFIDVTGRQALGMRVDERRHLLFVAGGFNGHAYVYDTRTGSTVADLALAPATGSLVNDVALTPTAAYFTDTFRPVLYRVGIAANGSLGPVTTIALSGPAATTGGFGVNGIDATPDGSVLVVAHTALGILATVNPTTGASRAIRLTSGALVAGTLDGLQLEGHTAWVVQNFANSLAEVRLSADLSTGAVVQTITDTAFRVPTTAAVFGSRVAVVNGRFDLGFPPPLGPGAPAGTSFNVVLVSR